MTKRTLSEAITYMLGRTIQVPQADLSELYESYELFENRVKYSDDHNFIIDNSSPRKYGESLKRHKKRKK